MTTFAIPTSVQAQLGVIATVTLEPHELPTGTLAQTKIRALGDYLRWQTLNSATASFPSTGATAPATPPANNNLPEQYNTVMVVATQPGVVTLP